MVSLFSPGRRPFKSNEFGRSLRRNAAGLVDALQQVPELVTDLQPRICKERGLPFTCTHEELVQAVAEVKWWHKKPVRVHASLQTKHDAVELKVSSNGVLQSGILQTCCSPPRLIGTSFSRMLPASRTCPRHSVASTWHWPGTKIFVRIFWR